MKAKRFFLSLCLVAATLAAAAQNGKWYFGNTGGMSFSISGTAPLAGSVMNQSEGCASVVDPANNVVMYTNGISVWNGNHVSQGVTLSGHASATQSAVIVPIPNTNCTQYYIFTVSAAETDYGNGTGAQGFRVSLATVAGVAPSTTVTIVPADLDVNLLSGSNANDVCSEKLTAVSDGSGGYWVVSHGVGLYSSWSGGYTGPVNTGGEGKFYAVHVTAANNTIALLGASMVTSTFVTGLHQSNTVSGGGGHYDGQGQMKFNPAGTRLACATTTSQSLQLYNFSAVTGVFSGQLLMTPFGSNDGIAYGVEFSPSGNYLYVSTTFFFCSLNQFDATLGTAAAISASRVTLAVSPNYNNMDYYFGQLQLGPDNKIYVAGLNHTALDVITAPDLLACGFVSAGAPISGTSKLGLPNVVLKSPCEGNLYEECPCYGQSSLIQLSPIHETGTGTVALSLASGGPVKKLKITLVNFNQLALKSCKACNPATTNRYGTFFSPPVIMGATPLLTPATNPGTAVYSREVTWTYATPQVISQSVTLNVQFPPVNAGCQNGVEFALRVEYIDANCKVCETLIFVTFGNSPARMHNPDQSETGESSPEVDPVTPIQNMKLFPNPATSSVTVQLPATVQGGTIQVYNSLGMLVLEQPASGATQTFDTGTLPAGVYSVRYASGNNQYMHTLVIEK